MMLLDFEVERARPLVPLAGVRDRDPRRRSERLALGAMKTQWYAAIFNVGEVLALKELLVYDDSNDLRLVIAGPNLIENTGS